MSLWTLIPEEPHLESVLTIGFNLSKDAAAPRCHLDCVNMTVLKSSLPTQIQSPFGVALFQLQLLQCFFFAVGLPTLFSMATGNIRKGISLVLAEDLL